MAPLVPSDPSWMASTISLLEAFGVNSYRDARRYRGSWQAYVTACAQMSFRTAALLGDGVHLSTNEAWILGFKPGPGSVQRALNVPECPCSRLACMMHQASLLTTTTSFQRPQVPIYSWCAIHDPGRRRFRYSTTLALSIPRIPRCAGQKRSILLVMRHIAIGLSVHQAIGMRAAPTRRSPIAEPA